MTSAPTPDAKLDTVRKLLNKAERASTEHEAEAFRAKAMELMQRYSIDEALLSADHDTGDKIGSRRYVIRGWVKPKGEMLAWVGTTFGCQTIKHGNESSIGTAVLTMYGWESDLAMVEVLFTSLEIQAMRALNQAKIEHMRSGSTVNTQAYTRSFLVGFASTVARRLEDQRKSVVQEHAGSGAELVLVDRSVAVDVHFKQANPRVRIIQTSTVTAGSGFTSGVTAGQRADLGQGGLNGQRRAVGR